MRAAHWAAKMVVARAHHWEAHSGESKAAKRADSRAAHYVDSMVSQMAESMAVARAYNSAVRLDVLMAVLKVD